MSEDTSLKLRPSRQRGRASGRWVQEYGESYGEKSKVLNQDSMLPPETRETEIETTGEKDMKSQNKTERNKGYGLMSRPQQNKAELKRLKGQGATMSGNRYSEVRVGRPTQYLARGSPFP